MRDEGASAAAVAARAQNFGISEQLLDGDDPWFFEFHCFLPILQLPDDSFHRMQQGLYQILYRESPRLFKPGVWIQVMVFKWMGLLSRSTVNMKVPRTLCVVSEQAWQLWSDTSLWTPGVSRPQAPHDCPADYTGSQKEQMVLHAPLLMMHLFDGGRKQEEMRNMFRPGSKENPVVRMLAANLKSR